MLKENDWNQYRNYFPERYWKYGSFDIYLEQNLPNLSGKNVLDIGGGIQATQILQKFDLIIDLLDPFINQKPDFINRQVNYNTLPVSFYHLMIARGSINYLTENEFNQLEASLHSTGIIIFNTFLKEPHSEWKEKSFKNLLGEKGIERSRLHQGMIEHELVFDNFSIKHKFYYRSIDFFKKYFNIQEIKNYGHNSSIIMAKKYD